MELEGNKDRITKNARDIKDAKVLSLYRRWLQLQQMRAKFERDVLDVYTELVSKNEDQLLKDFVHELKSNDDRDIAEISDKDDKIETYIESDFATAISK